MKVLKGLGAWNNGKSGAKLVLTSSTTPGLQIHKFDHSRTANPCDWLLCCRAALPLVGCPHSIVYSHLPVVEGLISLIWEPPSHYSMSGMQHNAAIWSAFSFKQHNNFANIFTRSSQSHYLKGTLKGSHWFKCYYYIQNLMRQNRASLLPMFCIILCIARFK